MQGLHPQFETSITYRDIRADDFDALHDIVSDWNVARQLGGWPWPADAAFTRGRCKPYDGDGFIWAVCIDDRMVGSVGVTNGDLGYMYHPSVQGQGIASRAAKDAVAHAFATSQRDVLTGSTWFDNAASYSILIKLGFQHYMTRYMHAKARNRPTLVYHQRLTRADWDRLRTTAQ